MAQSIEQFIEYLGFNNQGDLGPFTTYTSKQGKLVYFPRAIPKEPASPDQIINRNAFRAIAQEWRLLPEHKRQAWSRLAYAAYQRVTGYNLFTYEHFTADTSIVNTLITRTGIDPR